VDLLNLISFLDSEGIPRATILGGAWRQQKTLPSIADNEIEFDDAVEALKRHSLIYVTGDLLSVHRLVQAINRDRLSEEIKRQWSEAAINLVNGAFSFDPEKSTDMANLYTSVTSRLDRNRTRRATQGSFKSDLTTPKQYCKIFKSES